MREDDESDVADRGGERCGGAGGGGEKVGALTPEGLSTVPGKPPVESEQNDRGRRRVDVVEDASASVVRVDQRK